MSSPSTLLQDYCTFKSKYLDVFLLFVYFLFKAFRNEAFISLMKAISYLDLYRYDMRSGAQCDCKHDRLWVRFLLAEIKYLIFNLFVRFALVLR